MSNKEYDDMYDELVAMEKKTGIVLEDSPTKRAGYAVVDSLPKEKHEFPALSLDKTKDITEFPKIFSVRDGLAVDMWKMDGSTLQVTYDNGKLVKAVTRGNGKIGNNITHNAPYIKGLPMEIPYTGHLVARGEAAMSYTEFNRINDSLPVGAEKYKNPRNLANATIQLLDSKEMAEREIWFFAFRLVHANPMISPHTFASELFFLEKWGFNVVESELVDATADPLKSYDAIENSMVRFSNRAETYDFPVDGLVVVANDIEYAESLPATDKHPHKLAGYAFKWADETAETTLREIEWSASRTGLINPVAVFDPVELEGTTVSRASLHNVSYLKNLRLRVGDKISVYKANKIIPQVAENLTPQGKLTYEESHPVNCPCCNTETNPIISDSGAEVAVCPNPNCPAKMIKNFVHFCDRNCMNIVGLSEETLTKFIEKGFLRQYSDLWHLDMYREEIVTMEGFGEKSYQKLISSVGKARETDFVSFITSLSIPNFGKGQAKAVYSYYSYNEENRGCDYVINFFSDIDACLDFTFIDGIGEAMQHSLMEWGRENIEVDGWIDDLLDELNFREPVLPTRNSILSGKTFVITGTLNKYPNRDALVAEIESYGGKVASSVSKNTDYLINNDVTSTSGKNKKAKELGIPIISEEDFLEILKE